MTQIPVVMILTCVVIVLCAVSGLLKGFVRKISGLVSFVLACILVSALLPTITSALRTTPVYTAILNQCETIGSNLVKNAVTDVFSAGGAAGADPSSIVQSVTADDGSGMLDREKIKAQLQAYGYDPSLIDSMSDAELQSYAQQLIGATAGALSPAILPMDLRAADLRAADLPLLSIAGQALSPVLLAEGTAQGSMPAADASQGGSSLLSQVTSAMSRSDQIRFIEDLPLPDSLKEQMETFNNAAGYAKLGASDFGSYVVRYIANLILNVLAFLVTLIVSWAIIRLILGALSIFSSLPIIGSVDRLLGLLLGIVQGVMVMWVLFLILSLLATTPAGKTLMDEINHTPFLSALYNSNLLMNSTTRALSGIM